MTTIQFLAEWGFRSAILILSGALLLWALRVKAPSIRLAAWTAMLFGSLAIPAITAALPKVPFALRVPRPAAAPEVENEAPATADPAKVGPDAGVDVPGAGASKPFDWARAGLMLYVLVAGVLVLRVGFGLTMSLRLLGRSRATGQASEGIEIRESDEVASPAALGIVRPAIVLPVDWREWDGAKLDAVLAHERSHIQRHDPAVQLLSAIHRALVWHSPLSWILHRNIVRVAEDASDDAAVEATRDRVSYAEVLLDFMQRGVRGATWQGVPMARYGRPEERIHRILEATGFSRGVTRRSVAAILALGAPLAYVVGAAHPESAPPAQAALRVAERAEGSGLSLEPARAQAEAAAQVAATPAPSAQTSPPPATASRQGAGNAAADSPEKPLTFDVASVKPVSRMQSDGRILFGMKQPIGGPGTKAPGRVDYPAISLRFLLIRAFAVKSSQIVGPDWLDTEFFEIHAIMPPSTTMEQFRVMHQNLLAERFKLAFHRGTQEIPIYSLVVAKNGTKMKESVGEPAPPDDGPPPPPRGRPQLGADGFPTRQTPLTHAGFDTRIGLYGMRMIGRWRTVQDLAQILSVGLGQVNDETGLTAKYDFTLTYVPPDVVVAPGADPLPDIFRAVQEQLGLRLEPRKGSGAVVETIVIDHLEKTPTAN